MIEPLEQRLTHDAQEALKNHDARRREILTTLLAAVKKARIDAAGKKFGPDEELTVLEKSKKSREESIELYVKANRADMADREREEVEIIKTYLPEPLGEAEVKAIIVTAVEELSATTIKDMGKVLAIVMPQTKGRFDAGKVASFVKSALGAS